MFRRKDGEKDVAAMLALLLWCLAASGCESPAPGYESMPSGRWEVHVTDTAGRPIAGATIVPEWNYEHLKCDVSFDEFVQAPEVKTDTAGVALLTRARDTLLPPSVDWMLWTLRVSAPGYMAVRFGLRDVQLKKDPTLVVLRPLPATSTSGFGLRPGKEGLGFRG